MLPRFSRRRFLQMASSLTAGGIGVGLYTWQIEPHWIDVVRRDMAIPALPAALEGKLLVQLSDIHVGPRVDDDYLRNAFSLVNALEPALVAITGDFMTCNGTEQIDHALRVLPDLKPGKLGSFAVLGNHDYGWNWREGHVAAALTKGLADQGVQVLRNQQQVVSGLTIVGLDDLWSRNFSTREALAGLTPETPTLALCHNPDGVDAPGWEDFRGWILSGHTHGGQCRAPFLPPPIVSVKNKRYIAGVVDLGEGRNLYINRALGHLLRVRFNVRPEITVFRLTRTVA